MIASLFGWISIRWLRLPLTVGTILLTVAVAIVLFSTRGWIASFQPSAAHLAAQIDLEALVLHGMLGPLLFAGAYLLDIDELWRQKVPVALFATIGTLLAAVIVTSAFYAVLHLIGYSVSWIECAFFGALISPTDPIAVLDMLKRAGIAVPIQAQLAGESLFNDAIGAVLFLTVLHVARGHSLAFFPILGHLLIQTAGGVLLGIAAAWLTSQLMSRVRSFQVELLLTITLALGGYVLADTVGVSAPLAAIVAGIALRRFSVRGKRQSSFLRIDYFWEATDHVQNAVLFVLVGLEVLSIRFSREAFFSGGVAILLVTATRLFVVAALLACLRRLSRSSGQTLFILTWGGLRGGLSLALALTVPAAQGRAWILPCTYLVVVFSILVQGGSMPWLLSRRTIVRLP